jgi:hypothetical protein
MEHLTIYQISKGDKLQQLLDSIELAREFVTINGPGHYELKQLFLDPITRDPVSSRVWGSIDFEAGGRVVINRMPDDPAERLRRSGYHEAGHAVAAICNKKTVERIELTPDDPNDGGITYIVEPVVQASSQSLHLPHEMEEIRRFLEIFAGGSAAETIAMHPDRSAPPVISIGDVLQMTKILEQIGLDKDLDAAIIAAFERVYLGLRQPLIWAQVDALARALMERRALAADEVLGICERARTVFTSKASG